MIKAILILLFLIAWELPKRIIYAFVFLFAYPNRNKLRVEYKQENILTERLYKFPKNEIKQFLYFALDDSINIEGRLVYNVDVEYCWYGKRSDWVESLHEVVFKEFWRSFYWSCWRNNSINRTNIIAYRLGKCESFKHYGNDRSYLEIRTYTNGKVKPYLQWYIKGDWRIQIGYLKNARYEIALEKRKA